MKKSIQFALIFSIIIILLLATHSIGFWGFWGLMILNGVIAQIWYSTEKEKERKEQRKKINNQLSNLENFKTTKRLVGPWGLIAIDDINEQIAIKESKGNIRKYPYSEIIGCEIIENGETTYRKSSIIGRAIIGGVIAGGAGAIIGGLSGKLKKDKEIKNLDFKITFKDTNRPNFTIKFFDAWEESARTKKSIKINDAVYGPILEKSLIKLKNWKDILEIIIDNQDNLNKKSKETEISISDELLKLNDLKEKGIITQDEFEKQKKKILK